MKYVVIYDITDDDLRNSVAEILKNFGLMRIQKSAFFGELDKNTYCALIKKLDETVKTDVVHVLPLCSSCFSEIKTVGYALRPKEEPYVIL
ncbi:MAG: CRISPR-associated endonuclease Cas2 [Candidatus Micrarchaeia archaeon]